MLASYLLNGWTVTFVMLAIALAVGLLRWRNGGALLSSDRNVRDAVNGVGIYILISVLVLLHVNPAIFSEVLNDNFGQISVNAAFAQVILVRFEALYGSAKATS